MMVLCSRQSSTCRIALLLQLLLLLLLLSQSQNGCYAFVPSPHPFGRPQQQQSSRKTTTRPLQMVFDFFKERSKEGLDQLSNLSKSAGRGELGKGLADAASYTTQTNQAFADGLQKSRNRLLQDMETLLTGVSPEEVLEELQDILLQADLGAQTAEDIVTEVQSLREDSTKMLKKNDLKSIMRGILLQNLDTTSGSNENESSSATSARAIQFSTDPTIPTVLFVMGANGMGKTTTIGKLAYRLRTEGNQTVLLAACDTFRAGAVEQLQQWADRANVTMVGPTSKATTPSAVLYGALDEAMQRQVDTVLVDTSGRLSNNDALTAELAKMKKVIQKRLSVSTDEAGAPVWNEKVPHETLLVLDAAQGRMALDSAKAWDESIGLTGLILTKLDGSARGGSVVAVSRDLGLPVKLIGVGEGIEDLRDFEPSSFVDGLLGIGAAGGKSAGEGALLAKRLVEMRKERDIRAKTKPKVKVPEVAVQPQQPQSTQQPRKQKNKKKKKKAKK